MQGDQETGEEQRVSDHFFPVLAVAGFVVAFVLDPAMKFTEVERDTVLCGLVKRWVPRDVCVKAFLDGRGSIGVRFGIHFPSSRSSVVVEY